MSTVLIVNWLDCNFPPPLSFLNDVSVNVHGDQLDSAFEVLTHCANLMELQGIVNLWIYWLWIEETINCNMQLSTLIYQMNELLNNPIFATHAVIAAGFSTLATAIGYPFDSLKALVQVWKLIVTLSIHLNVLSYTEGSIFNVLLCFGCIFCGMECRWDQVAVNNSLVLMSSTRLELCQEVQVTQLAIFVLW